MRLYPVDEKLPEGWALPSPMALGEFVSAGETWRELANEPRDAPEEPA